MSENSKITTTKLIQCTGIFLMIAGMLYITIQFIHPADHLSSVNKNLWQIVAVLTVVMSIFAFIGTLGIYVKQIEESGWLGLIGATLFSAFWLISMTFSAIEGFVLPLLTDVAPEFVEGMVGLFGEAESQVALGIFPVLAILSGLFYMLGGLLLGIAIFKAKVFPPMIGLLLAFSAVITLAGAIIPHPYDRLLAIPMGITFIWLGYALWNQHRISFSNQLVKN